jgi:hypothetical protein
VEGAGWPHLDREETHVTNQAPESLGEIELRYAAEARPTTPPGRSLLPYLGSGEGHVLGGPLRGRIRFSTFEDDLSGRSCLVSGVGACALNVAMRIETDDAAEVRLDALGYAVRDGGTRWRTTLGVRIASDDPRYMWLGGRLLTWLGEFDEQTGAARAVLFGRPREDSDEIGD